MPLLEYLARDINDLRRYLMMSESDKKSGLSQTYWFTWEHFVDDYPDFTEGYKVEEWEDAENLPTDIKDEWDDWLYDHIDASADYAEIGITPEDLPSWTYVEFREIVKKKWLVHQTNNADDIARDGFQYGVNDLSRLGLTTYFTQAAKVYGGYNFAYDINDVDLYGMSYGHEAVFFMASGVKVYHYTDQEMQVIFFGQDASDFIPVTSKDFEGNWILQSVIDGSTIVKMPSLGDLGDWIRTNYRQYSKQLGIR